MLTNFDQSRSCVRRPPRQGASRAATYAFALIAGTLVVQPSLVAEDWTLDCRVEYVTPDGVFIDVGSAAGVRVGLTGTLSFGARSPLQVEVIHVARDSSLLRPLEPIVRSLEIGENASLRFAGVGPPTSSERDEAAEVRSESPTLKTPGEEDDFVPLLAVPPRRSVGLTEEQNIFRGRVWLRQLLQFDAEQLRDYSVTRLGSSGSVERIGGSAWSLSWSGELSYRDGHALEDTPDYEEPRLRLFDFSLSRRFDDRSTVRVGRFLPRELPAVGYLDGVQGEKVLHENFRVGLITGFKPTRARLDFSGREPTAVPYFTFEAGESGRLYYSGTAGVLGSLYRGKPDRLALLVDQVAHLTHRLSLFSTLEADLDVGGAEFRDGAQLTHVDAVASYFIAPLLTLRGGVDEYQQPDTAAERDAIDFDDEALFDDRYWRYWIGASHDLFWRLRLSEEVSLTESSGEERVPRWNVALTRSGLPWLPSGSITVLVYNLESSTTDGYGGRVTAYLPFLESRLTIYPSVVFRFLEVETDFSAAEDFTFTDVALRADWRITDAWSAYGGVSHALGDGIERYFVDLGLTYRW